MTASIPLVPDTRIAAADRRQDGHRYVAGDRRASGWTPIDQVHCPLGHEFKDPWLPLGEHIRRCGFALTSRSVARRGGVACGVITWELWCRPIGFVFVAEIDHTDLATMKDLTLREKLVYLGAPMWPTRQRSA